MELWFFFRGCLSLRCTDRKLLRVSNLSCVRPHQRCLGHSQHVPPMGMHKEKPGPQVLWHAISHLSLSLLFFHTVQVLWAYHATLHKTQGLIANGRGGGKETRVMARCRPHGCQPFPRVPKCWHCLNLQIGAASSHGGRVRWYRDALWCRDPLLGKLWPCHHCQPSYWVPASLVVSAGLGTARGSLEEQWHSPWATGMPQRHGQGCNDPSQEGFRTPQRVLQDAGRWTVRAASLEEAFNSAARHWALRSGYHVNYLNHPICKLVLQHPV